MINFQGSVYRSKPPRGTTVSTASPMARKLAFAAYYAEGSGSMACDYSGNRYVGTLQGTSSQTSWGKTTKGIVVTLDGLNGFVDHGVPKILGGAQKLTVVAGVRFNTIAVNQSIAVEWDYQTQGCFALQSGSTSSTDIRMFVANGLTDAGTNYGETTNAGLTTGVDYSLAAVYNGTQTANGNGSVLNFFRNATLLTTSYGGTIPSSLTSASSTLKIGKFGGTLTRPAAISINYIYIFLDALNQNQLFQIYRKPYRVMQVPMVRRMLGRAFVPGPWPFFSDQDLSGGLLQLSTSP